MIKALQNVKDQKWNAGVAIAEAGGLAQMLVDAGSGIAKIRRDFIRGDFRSAYNRFRRKHGFQSWVPSKSTTDSL
jgi:delta 1-pyrroline-5-carboxylate dehydrogenase